MYKSSERIKLITLGKQASIQMQHSHFLLLHWLHTLNYENVKKYNWKLCSGMFIICALVCKVVLNYMDSLVSFWSLKESFLESLKLISVGCWPNSGKAANAKNLFILFNWVNEIGVVTLTFALKVDIDAFNFNMYKIFLWGSI